MGVVKTPLQRMGAGVFLCALSFAISGVVEMELQVRASYRHPTNIASVDLVMGCPKVVFFFFTFLTHLPWRTNTVHK